MDSLTPTIRPELLAELLKSAQQAGGHLRPRRTASSPEGRPDGAQMATGPVSVWTVLPEWPSRLLPLPRPSVISASSMSGCLGTAKGRSSPSWGAKYPAVIRLWHSGWPEVVPFLAYPKEIRKILYTTNIIESLNAQLRKVLRPKGHFKRRRCHEEPVSRASTSQAPLEATHPLAESSRPLRHSLRRPTAA
jgi:hypothetical protein